MTRQQQINPVNSPRIVKKTLLSKIYLLVILLALYSSPAYPQIKFEIAGNKHFTETDYKLWIDFSAALNAKDISVDSIKNKITTSLSKEGFYNPFIEKIEIDSTWLRITILEGNATNINSVKVKGVLSDSLYVRNELDMLEGEHFSSSVLENAFGNILTHYENTGFPFALIKLESVSFETDSTTDEHFADLLLTISEGEKARINKILVEGNHKTKDYVVTRAARVSIGEYYNQKIINDIPNRLNRLRFFEHVEAPNFYITKSHQGILKILVKEKETNSFDGIAGYVPGKGENEAGYFTGYININLRNLFGTGRAALIKWHQENISSQELEIRYLEPWLFGYPFNVQVDLFQRKQDSSYVQRNIGVHLEYLANENLSAALLVNSQSTIPTERAGGVLTVFNSTSFTTGFNLKADTRDDYYAPTKGLLFTTSYKFTQKKLNVPQHLITASAQTKLNHQRIEFDFFYFQKLFERQILSFALHGRELKGSNFDLSDLYFLGGTNTLRGYREKQFQGSRLLWSNTEYRFLISRRTYAFTFFDYGYALSSEDLQLKTARNSLYKSGYGFGLNIETGLGVLGISFALGSGDSFSKGKIHFSIINEF
ncbi:MAG: BamA/TamA family outer membrane protein [Bacteroidota bacterium]